MTNQIRVRYGKVAYSIFTVEEGIPTVYEDVYPKNTLVTIKSGDFLYFGIARCNFKLGDSFRRKLGRRIAQGRAELKMKLENHPEEVFYLSPTGLSGWCHQSELKFLLNYFYNIDDILRTGKIDWSCVPQLTVEEEPNEVEVSDSVENWT